MKHVPCNFCGSNDAIERYLLKDWQTKKEDTFQLVQCQKCGLLYLNPQPTWEELEGYYPEEYRPYVQTPEGGRSTIMVRAERTGWRRRAKVLLTYKLGGRLLDIGCATGEFLAEMELHSGWDCYGVEPVAFAANYARKKTHAQIFGGTVLEAHYPSDFFDVVTLWDVLEHVPDPVSIFYEARRILKPGGMLVICTPDPDSVMARWFGSNWFGLDAPRHLYDFSKSILVRRLGQENFNRVEIKYLSSDHSIFFKSLAILFQTKGWLGLSRMLNRIANSIIMRILLAAFFLIIRWLKVGASPVYFAWKS